MGKNNNPILTLITLKPFTAIFIFAFILFGYVYSKAYPGVALILGGSSCLSYWIFHKLKKDLDEFALLAVSIQSGLLLWATIGLIFLGTLTWWILLPVLGMSCILWFVLRFSKLPLLVLIVFQISYFIFTFQAFLETNSDSAVVGLVTRMVLSGLALLIMIWILIEMLSSKKKYSWDKLRREFDGYVGVEKYNQAHSVLLNMISSEEIINMDISFLASAGEVCLKSKDSDYSEKLFEQVAKRGNMGQTVRALIVLSQFWFKTAKRTQLENLYKESLARFPDIDVFPEWEELGKKLKV